MVKIIVLIVLKNKEYSSIFLMVKDILDKLVWLMVFCVMICCFKLSLVDRFSVVKIVKVIKFKLLIWISSMMMILFVMVKVLLIFIIDSFVMVIVELVVNKELI